MAVTNSTEVWRPIPGYEGWYSVSNTGRVRRDKAERGTQAGHILVPFIRDGYCVLTLWKHGYLFRARVHRLVLSAFVGAPGPNQETRHLNGIRTDNRVDNLCWGTRLENVQDKVGHGSAKLTADVVRFIRITYAKGGCTQQDLGDRFGVSQSYIGRLVRRCRCTHIR